MVPTPSTCPLPLCFVYLMGVGQVARAGVSLLISGNPPDLAFLLAVSWSYRTLFQHTVLLGNSTFCLFHWEVMVQGSSPAPTTYSLGSICSCRSFILISNSVLRAIVLYYVEMVARDTTTSTFGSSFLSRDGI